jgi:hypothetical protein
MPQQPTIVIFIDLGPLPRYITKFLTTFFIAAIPHLFILLVVSQLNPKVVPVAMETYLGLFLQHLSLMVLMWAIEDRFEDAWVLGEDLWLLGEDLP